MLLSECVENDLNQCFLFCLYYAQNWFSTGDISMSVQEREARLLPVMDVILVCGFAGL